MNSDVMADVHVWIPMQRKFYRYSEECRKLYESLQDKICDPNSFDFICKNTFFYLFEKGGILQGAIYYFTEDDGRLFVNAFSKRKNLELHLNCLKMSLEWFRERVYAEAQNRASALCLLRCGFKRVEGKLFVFERNA